MIRFIHTADIHFGMENYGRIDQETGIHSRLLDFEKALNFCIDTAITQDVDLFVFAGDAYKTAYPSPTQQKLLLRCFLRLYKANIPVVIVVGNHDNPLSFGKANSLEIFATLPFDGFHVFAKPESKTIQTKSGPIQIVGIPWPNRHHLALSGAYHTKNAIEITEQISEKLSSIISRLAQELDPKLPAILAGHLTVSSGIFSGSEKRAVFGHDPILLPSQLAIPPFNYVALGHLHRFQDLNEDGGIPVVYSGSVERVDFGERKEEKGFCLVTIDDNLQTSYEFIKTPIRKFVQVDVIIYPQKNQTEQILQALAQHDIIDAVVKITYKLPNTEIDSVDIKRIQYTCNKAWYIVGIIPIRSIETKTHRNFLSLEMDLPTLLKKYFQERPLTKDRADTLLEKTLQLQQKKEADELEENSSAS